MGPTLSYELHILRGGEWIIDRVYESRDDAYRDARAIVAANPQASLQLIEERFDPQSGNSQETAIFRAQPVDKGAATFRRRPAAGQQAKSSASAGFRLSPAVITTLIAAAAFVAGLFVGLAQS
jgi:hypothetical protein